MAVAHQKAAGQVPAVAGLGEAPAGQRQGRAAHHLEGASALGQGRGVCGVWSGGVGESHD